MTTEEFLEEFPASSKVSISTPARTHWVEMLVLLAGVVFCVTGVWPWFVAGEPVGSTAFFSSVCAFGLGVFSYETYRLYNSFVAEIKEANDSGVSEVSSR